MAKILINNTASAINLDIGLTIPASGQLTIPPQDYDEAAASDDIVTEVGAGNLTVNDGSFDLAKSDGIRFIQGGYTNRVQVDNDLLSSDRIKVDVTGTLSDSTIKVSSNDTTVGFLEDKIVSLDNKLAITTLNDGSDEDLQIAVQSGNINTSELNNDANFIDSAGAPVQPADIADFETSTELDARDTANRDRANHTGTQLASTISDFNSAASAAAPVQSADIADFETSTELDARDVDNRDRANHTGTQLASTISDFTSAVQAAETTTSISLGSNILSYVDENGTTTNIDLSLYLDDTNLSRITSGTLNAVTGIATFTRDDTTTFTVDFSSLIDIETLTSISASGNDITYTDEDGTDTVLGNFAKTDLQNTFSESQNISKSSGISSLSINSDDNEATVIFRAGTPENLWAAGADDFTNQFVISSTNGLSASQEFNINADNNTINFQDKRGVELLDPIDDQDAATKAYVDAKTSFKDFARTDTPAGTQSTSFQQYLRLTTTIPETGNYKVSWSATWSYNNTSTDFLAQLELDDTTVIDDFRREPQDSSGTGITVTNLLGGTFNTGTNQRLKYSGEDVLNIAAGSHTIDLDLAGSATSNEATFYRACISIERWD